MAPLWRHDCRLEQYAVCSPCMCFVRVGAASSQRNRDSCPVDTPHGSSRGILRQRTWHPIRLAPDGPARPDGTDAWSEEQALTQAVQPEYSTPVQGGAIPLPEGRDLRAEEGMSNPAMPATCLRKARRHRGMRSHSQSRLR